MAAGTTCRPKQIVIQSPTEAKNVQKKNLNEWPGDNGDDLAHKYLHGDIAAGSVLEVALPH